MKADRLTGILSILLRREEVTAPYLANKFEVSRRIINRNIEDTYVAGIPIVTARGAGGGIPITKGFRMGKTLFTSWEMQSILAGPRSLDNVSGTNRYKQLMGRLAVGNQDLISMGSYTVINLSPWYKESLIPKIKLIQDAIEDNCLIHLSYYSLSGETRRAVELYALIFQWASWYVWGCYYLRQDYRMFKLNRMVGLELKRKHSKKRNVPAYEDEPDDSFPIWFQVKATCQPRIKWRVVEEFGVESLAEVEDDRLLLQAGYSDKGNLLPWVPGLGSQVELLELIEFREDLLQITNVPCRQYEQT